MSAEERFLFGMRNVQRALDEFAGRQREHAEYLMAFYRRRKLDMPFDVYRAAAFFLNREYLNKSGSLYLLYQADERLQKELPPPSIENIVERVAYIFAVFGRTLEEAGY
jgi:hypothetical protein